MALGSVSSVGQHSQWLLVFACIAWLTVYADTQGVPGVGVGIPYNGAACIFPSVGAPSCGGTGIPSNNYDAATNAWVTAVIAAGGIVSATEKRNVNTLVLCLKSNSLFSLIDRMWLFASENTFQAGIDIVNLGTLTVHGTPTFAAGQGYTGDELTAYFDSGWIPSSAGGHLTQNSASWGVYNRSARGIGAGNTDDSLGAQGTTITWNIENTAYNGGNGSASIDDDNASPLTLATPNSSGLWIASRTGATARVLYRNGSGGSSTSDAQASSGLPNRSIFILGRNSGSPDHLSADQLAVVFWGAGLNSTQAGNMAACVNAYMTALGTNVY